jgi:DNA polymerase-1
MTQRIALIDGDVIVYAASWAAQEEVDFGDSIQIGVDKDKVREVIDEMVCDIEADVQSDRSLVCLSPSKNFRNDLYPEYKANRKKSSKPVGYKVARDHFEANFEMVLRPGLEADDVMGIIATGGSRKYAADEHVICSPDKDMRQVPGLHYNWQRPDEGVFEVTPAAGEWKFWTQVLMGDSTDNIKGLPNVGPKTAEKILFAASESPSDQWWAEVIVPEHEKRGLTEEYALLTARLVKILQAEDYDNKKKEPILWTP